MLKRIMQASLLVAAGLFAAPALADGSLSDTMHVHATVLASCSSITAGNLDFGSLHAGDSATGEAEVTVHCTQGSLWTIDGNLGSNNDGTQRRLHLSDDGSHYMNYGLFIDDSHDHPFGTEISGGHNVTGTGTGGTQSTTIYGLITGSDSTDAAVGDYYDDVLVTVNF